MRTYIFIFALRQHDTHKNWNAKQNKPQQGHTLNTLHSVRTRNINIKYRRWKQSRQLTFCSTNRSARSLSRALSLFSSFSEFLFLFSHSCAIFELCSLLTFVVSVCVHEVLPHKKRKEKKTIVCMLYGCWMTTLELWFFFYIVRTCVNTTVPLYFLFEQYKFDAPMWLLPKNTHNCCTWRHRQIYIYIIFML